MADTWTTPTRKNDLLKYIEDLKKISGGPVEEEDLYAAGFSEKDLEEIGWFNAPEKASTMSGDGAKLEAYTPTSRDNVRNNIAGGLRGLGLDKQLARSVAVKIAGEENPADGGLGMGVADFTPLGALFGVEEGVASAKRGVKTGDYTTAGLGVLEAATNVASALPGGKVVSQGVNKLAEKLAGQYDPSVVRTFFGPTSAKADLRKLEEAKKLSAEGVDEQAVWQQTGWWNGPNGWRFEVDDSQMPMPYGSSEINMHGPTQDVVAHKGFWESLNPREEMLDDDATVDAFNEQDIRRRVVGGGSTDLGPMDAGREYKGLFDPNTSSMKAYGYEPTDQKETLVHEMQHAIQYVFGDQGTGTNPKWVENKLKATLDELPADQRSAAINATELGYSAARLKEIDFSISQLEKKIAEEAALNEDALIGSIESSGEVPFDWGQADTSSSDAEMLDALYKEQERLSEDFKGKEKYLASVAKSYPEFGQALEEFKILGEGVGTQFFASTPNFSEDLFFRKNIFKDEGKLEDFAAHTLYQLDAGEVEARVAGDRANWLPEERSFYPPASDVANKDYIYNQTDLLNWLEGVKGDAAKGSKKGYAKGGVVQETDPISGNKVPPGAEPEEVRDDVDAKLSDGEYVIPADVVRYIGLDKIEKMIAQAKEGLSEMDKQGRIGGEPLEEEDDLPFSDEELMSEEMPVGMAAGGMVSAGDRIRNNAMSAVGPTQTPQSGLPPWMVDPSQEQQPSFQRDSWADRQAEKTPMGMAGAVETWKAKDFTNVVKQRSGDPGVGVVEKIISTMPFGGLAMKARHKYLDKKVPGAIDSMIASGKDVDGTPLTQDQISELQKAKIDFAKTVGYEPGGLKSAVKTVAKSIIKPKEPPAKTEDKSQKTNNKESAADKKASSSPSKSSSKDKKDDKKK